MNTDNLSPDTTEFLSRASTAALLLAARRFVALLESTDLNNELFYAKAHAALLDLYSTGCNLDQIEIKYSSNDDDFEQGVVFDDKNKGQIAELGMEAFYWDILDPTYAEKEGPPNTGWIITDREATQGWLVDDFADIYRDLKIELLKIDTIGTTEAIKDALWHLKWSFKHHWGKHCINALKYFHALNYEGKQSESLLKFTTP